MRSPTKRLAIFASLLACLLVLGGCSALEREEAGPRVSMVAETIDGEVIDVGPLLEQDALIWFWAPW